mmetsp:Transcript_18790/g.23398  ORF Transcript_18790/g.23398 Transcript_18790/m.23398 type:complete len:144 (-) Transcript_18790:682-1113(-)
MTSYWIWFPVQNLKSISRPEKPSSNSYQVSTLNQQFDATASGAAVIFARQTILQLFKAMQNSGGSLYRMMQSEAFLLHDIIAWGCLESFSESPITGWMSEFSQAIPISHATQSAKKSKAQGEAAISEAESNRLIASLLDSEID